MKSHEVVVDRSSSVPKMSFAPVFNISMCFVDRHLAEGRSSKVMARGPRGDLTYAQLADGTYRMAAALGHLGVKRGDRVLLLMTDCPAFYFAFLGVTRLGAIAVLANTYLKAADYAYIVEESGAAAMIVAPVSMTEVAMALTQPEISVPHKIVAEGDCPSGWLSMEELCRAEDGQPPAAEETNATTDCFILYSSGSTGKPKGCVHQHKDLVYLAVLYAEQILGLHEKDVIFSIGKLFFAYGINNSLGFVLWAGCSVILLEDRVTAENSLTAIEAGKPTVYFSVPTMLVHQVAAVRRGVPAEFGSLRACVCGGEPLPPALFEQWKSITGLELVEGVGSSEALHIYISNEMGRAKPGSVGRPVPGYDIAIRDTEGRDLPHEGIGEIVVRGASVAEYYWKKPEKTAECMRDGWFHTGDTGYYDAGGFLFFCGRHDDMLRVGSMWVAPSEVESALMEHPAVLEVAVVGALDENQLVRPKAFIVLRDPAAAGPAMEADIITTVKSRLQNFKCPRWIVFMPDLPKTVTGKIQRFRLRTHSEGSR